MGMASEEHYLAYIEEFCVEEDGHLLYITEDASTLFVETEDIKELMGLFYWNSWQYLYSSKTSLLR